jgi:tRNA A37 threonylcarbamoyltransferase TsaD
MEYKQQEYEVLKGLGLIKEDELDKEAIKEMENKLSLMSAEIKEKQKENNMSGILTICRKIEDEIDAIDSKSRKSKNVSVRRQLRVERAISDYYQERIKELGYDDFSDFHDVVSAILNEVHDKVSLIIDNNKE